MFTGIVEAVGTVVEAREDRLVLQAPDAWPGEPWTTGESVAVNGVCLTVVGQGPDLAFDLSPETWRRTSFYGLTKGSKVNLERAMKATDRFGGHYVQGHVDAVGRLVSVQEAGESWVYRWSVPDAQYLVDKGSISLDGISLTVVEPQGGEFDVWIIPHTVEVTAIGTLKPGDPVNVEYDAVARYVEKLLETRFAGLSPR